MSKHTPGPWRENSFAGSDGTPYLACAVWSGDSKKFICATDNYDDWSKLCDEETQHENCRLIAAAPDLLEALKHIASLSYSTPAETIIDGARKALAKLERRNER